MTGYWGLISTFDNDSKIIPGHSPFSNESNKISYSCNCIGLLSNKIIRFPSISPNNVRGLWYVEFDIDKVGSRKRTVKSYKTKNH